jgi:hypothetical protein
VNQAQKALLGRLRELIEETPKSGALNTANRPLHVTSFARAVEARADDGDALVEYARAKVHAAPTGSYSALIRAGRPDLTVEALVADADAQWASEFTEVDRAAARERLGTMIEAHRETQKAAEEAAVVHDRKIMADVSARRVTKGRPALTPEQEAQMLKERAAKRAGDS